MSENSDNSSDDDNDDNNTNRYSRGLIYKIVSPHTEKIYIGSTTVTRVQRLRTHKQNYKQYLKGKYSYNTSYEIIKLEDVDIIEIERCSCKSRAELLAREKYWIEYYKDICVNEASVSGEISAKNKTFKIYKLISTHSSRIYVGRTCQRKLNLRLNGHRSDYNKYLKVILRC